MHRINFLAIAMIFLSLLFKAEATAALNTNTPNALEQETGIVSFKLQSIIFKNTYIQNKGEYRLVAEGDIEEMPDSLEAFIKRRRVEKEAQRKIKQQEASQEQNRKQESAAIKAPITDKESEKYNWYFSLAEPLDKKQHSHWKATGYGAYRFGLGVSLMGVALMAASPIIWGVGSTIDTGDEKMGGLAALIIGYMGLGAGAGIYSLGGFAMTAAMESRHAQYTSRGYKISNGIKAVSWITSTGSLICLSTGLGLTLKGDYFTGFLVGASSLLLSTINIITVGYAWNKQIAASKPESDKLSAEFQPALYVTINPDTQEPAPMLGLSARF